ncbi:Ribosomal protein L34e [uncultured archaeon]|nr:Ribosomal protein L34e [uncultured archaeon]
MPVPKNRSTSVRKIHKRIPSGNTLHFERRKKGGCHHCALSGDRLPGVASQAGKAKSAKRPNRKFGGALSSAVSSRIIRIASRVKEGEMKLDEVEIRLLPYVKRYLASKK